jgi:hypothetical protein
MCPFQTNRRSIRRRRPNYIPRTLRCAARPLGEGNRYPQMTASGPSRRASTGADAWPPYEGRSWPPVTSHPLPLRNPIKQPSRATMGVKRTAASEKRKKCMFKDDLIYSHGLLPLDSTGTSPCHFCICFGPEGTPPAEAAAAGSTGGVVASYVLQKKKRAVSRRHLKFDDFSRNRIEEHYKKSHPKQWDSYQRAVSQGGRSSKTNESLFTAEKITGHFARRDPLGEDKVVSKAVERHCCESIFEGGGPRCENCLRSSSPEGFRSI